MNMHKDKYYYALTSALAEAMQRARAVVMVVPSFIFLGFGFKEQSGVLGVIVLWKIMRRFWERRREVKVCYSTGTTWNRSNDIALNCFRGVQNIYSFHAHQLKTLSKHLRYTLIIKSY